MCPVWMLKPHSLEFSCKLVLDQTRREKKWVVAIVLTALSRSKGYNMRIPHPQMIETKVHHMHVLYICMIICKGISKYM